MIEENIEQIRERIRTAANKAGRDPDHIKLVAVSKFFSVDQILRAYAAGQRIFGENYIQEMVEKYQQLPEGATFHFIGHLQRNKVKLACQACNMIETIDSLNLAKTLNNHLERAKTRMNVLVQVNLGQESQKSGVGTDEVRQLLADIGLLPYIKVCGLMAIPPLTENPENTRPFFRRLRLLAESLAAQGLFPEVASPELSMGMSDDFEVAIEEGATIIRVGTAIFGRRRQE